MTAEELALHLGARRTGNGRWLARCPAHRDRLPSLSISSGRENRVLVHCWAGCDLAAVLKAAGLTFQSLFPAGPPPTKAQRDALDRQRRTKLVEANRERQANKEIRERVQKLTAIVNALGAKLARQPESDVFAAIFHQACWKLHLAEWEQEAYPRTKKVVFERKAS